MTSIGLFATVATGALVIEAVAGWPAWLYRLAGHPVGFFAWVIEALEQRWNRPMWRSTRRKALGVLLVLLLVLVAGGGAALLQGLLLHALGIWSVPLLVALAYPGLALRSLHDHVTPVAAALAAGDLSAARSAVAMIVGRDTAALDAAGVGRAAIESLSESFCDGVVAPLFWLVVLGLPGLWAYKALNTADSLIGHKEPRWRAFGWAAARADDIANLLPARLAGVLLCAVAAKGFHVMLRDAGLHASPNAGWPEAAMAGALGLRLAGPVSYDGVRHDKPWIGAGRADATAADVRRALALYRRACVSLLLITGGMAWAL